MKKILVIVLLNLCFIGNLKADLGAPTIQAICKITLKDGKTIEGIITFGPGGYEYNYKPHGFCFAHNNGEKQLILFGFSFGLFDPDNYAAYRSGTSKLYYIENVSKQPRPETKTEFNENIRIITVTTTEVDEYKLLDEMVMYMKLPMSLYVGFSQNNEDVKITIKVSEIKSVEILKNPSKIWLDLISSARERINNQIKIDEEKDNSAWIDYREPAWYHEIILDEQQVNYLKQFF